MKEVAARNGFVFERVCNCTQSGDIYNKNGMKLKILKGNRVFVLTVKGNDYSSTADNLQYTINKYGG